MSGINTGRAAGKSRGRGRSDDVTRSTTDDPDRGAEQSDSPADRSPEDDVDERDTGDRTGATGRPSTGREEGDEPSRRPDVPDRTDGSRPDSSPSSDPSSHPSSAQADRGSGARASSTSQRGRPAEIRNPQRTTVTLEADQVDFLDNTAARVKLNGGDKLSRGSILRAVLASLMQSGVDLSQADDETSLARLLLDRLDGRA